MFVRYYISIALLLSFELLILGGKAEVYAQAPVKNWPVRLQLQYIHQFQFAGFYAAAYRGFYAKAGLDVTIQEGQPGLDTIAAVERGHAEFGTSDTEVLWRRLAGAPLVALGVIFQNSAYCLVSLAKSNIMTLQDLRGKRVGIAEGRGSYLFKTLFKKQHMAFEELNIVPPKWNLQSLVRGETDVNGAYATGELYSLREQNLSFQVIYPMDYGVAFYGDTLFTSESFLAQNPEVVEKFRQASLEGWRYAFENVEEVIDYILTLDSVKQRGLSRDRLRYEATVMRHLILPDLIDIGSMSEARWTNMAKDLEALQPEKLKLERLEGFIYSTPAEQSMLLMRRLGLAAAGVLILFTLTLGWVAQLRFAVKQRTRDFEEAKRLADLRSEEARSASAAKTMFLASISHEFRTPLTAILGFSDLLKTTLLSDQQKNWIKIIKSRADDLLTLVNQTLDLIQSETGAAAPQIVDFELGQHLEEVRLSFEPHLQSRKITYSCELRMDPSVQIRGPALVLRQILINLIGNAIKAVDEGGNISLICEEWQPPEQLPRKRFYHFSLRDDGPGIPEELQPLVFDSFMNPLRQKFDKTPKGFGLGLTICKRLVSSLGGEIWFENNKDRGCTLHFTAYLGESSPKPVELSTKQEVRKILVVEDDPINRELIRTYLMMGGLTAVEVDTGQKAIATCEQELFDAILMDLGLPDIDGIKTSETIIKDQRSKNRQTPIIALTASDLLQERNRCLQVGMAHYLTKPIDFKQLMATLQTASRGAQAGI